MRLSCPSCQTEYDVPDAALAGRARKLRCVQCGHQWQTAPPATAEELALSPGVETQMLPEVAELPEERVFGVSADEAAEREVIEAAQHESDAAEHTAPDEGPMPLPGYGEDAADNNHREVLNMLVNASRGNAQQEETAQKPRKFGKAWLFSILVVLVFIAYVLLGRDHIIHVWPPSIRFYHALGLA